MTFGDDPIEMLSDREVLQLCELQMDEAQDRRLSELLKGQRESQLTVGDKKELNALMKIYETGLVRKSQALVEVVKRGLRSPLEP